jgi:hypothetical protein
MKRFLLIGALSLLAVGCQVSDDTETTNPETTALPKSSDLDPKGTSLELPPRDGLLPEELHRPGHH